MSKRAQSNIWYWWLLKYVLNVSFNSVVCNFPRDGDDDLALQCKGSAYFWIYIDTEARTFNSIESYQAFAESTRPGVNINSGVLEEPLVAVEN